MATIPTCTCAYCRRAWLSEAAQLALEAVALVVITYGLLVVGLAVL